MTHLKCCVIWAGVACIGSSVTLSLAVQTLCKQAASNKCCMWRLCNKATGLFVHCMIQLSSALGAKQNKDKGKDAVVLGM